MISALRIWFAILRCIGAPYAYILGHLPKASLPIFVDAASLVGLGVLQSTDYFMFVHGDILEFIHR